MKMTRVIPDPTRNPGVKDSVPACAAMAMYFHINSLRDRNVVGPKFAAVPLWKYPREKHPSRYAFPVADSGQVLFVPPGFLTS